MKFAVKFSETENSFDLRFGEADKGFNMPFGEIQTVNVSDYEIYGGSYRVTPAVSSQTLATHNKLMKSDLVVEEIPYAEVSNNSGGKTASIG